MEGIVAVQRVAAPVLNVTVPVASPGMPETDNKTGFAYGVEFGAAEAVIE